VPWWGTGVAPHLRWPGVTIEIAATWSGKRRRWESHGGRYYFDATAADKVCDFFPAFLTHHKGEFAGLPFELLPYQTAILRMAFGWKRAEDGLRRFRKVFDAVPKGNGKSPFGAGVCLFMLLCDGEDGAECYSAAAERDQAAIVFDTARIMVENSEELKARCEVFRRAITVPATNSTYRVLSADASTKHGFNIHNLTFDEFHAQKSRDLYEALYRGMVKRRQPMLLLITTAGDDDESICFEEWEYARGVQKGAIPDETYLPFIFEATADDDWQSEETWRRVNPGYGVTVKADAIRSEYVAAQAEPRKRNDFLRYHLNRWTNQAVSWIPPEWWDGCEVRGTGLAELQALVCAAGLDLAQKWDLAAFVVVFKRPIEMPFRKDEDTISVLTEAEDGQVVKKSISLNYRIIVRPYFWIPEETAGQHELEDGVPYRLWAEQGLVTLTEGAVIDYDRIYRDITEKIVPTYPKLKQGEIGYDPAFATDLATKLRDRGGLKVAEVLQNYKHLSEPSQVFEALVKGKRAEHDGHRLLHWNVGNVAIKQDDAGRIRPVKPKKNSKKRIDGVVATLMGLSRVNAMPEPPKRSSGRVRWAG
jgi:phage terminase large subunit-like protein